MSQTTAFILYSQQTGVVSSIAAEKWIRANFSMMRANECLFTFYYPSGIVCKFIDDKKPECIDHGRCAADKAVSIYKPGGYISCGDFVPSHRSFYENLNTEISEIDESIRHSATINSAVTGVGVTAIHLSGHTVDLMSAEELKTASMIHEKTNMIFSLWGYGTPIHIEEFGKRMMELETIVKIREQLETIAGPMKHYVSVSF